MSLLCLVLFPNCKQLTKVKPIKSTNTMFKRCCESLRKASVKVRRKCKTDAPEILMLNDYCFHQILQFVSLPELANFKESCSRFTAVADMEFLYRTRGKLFFGVREKDIDVKYCLQLIKQFGKCVTRLTIVCEELQGLKWSEILAAVKSHCTELQVIILRGGATYLLTKADFAIFNDFLNSRVRNLTSRAKSIQWDVSCNIYNYSGIFPLQSNIATSADTENEIRFDQNKDILPGARLSWRTYWDESRVERIVNTLLKRHRLTGFTVHNITLTERINFSQFFRMKHLTRVAIYCYNSNVEILKMLQTLQEVNASTSIRVLHLLSPKLNEAVVAVLAQLTCLKTLKLENGNFTTPSRFESLSLLCANPNFEHLIVLSYYQPIDKIKYLKLVKKRKKSIEAAMLTDNFLRRIMLPKKRCLHLALGDSVYTASSKLIPAELLQANEATIKLFNKLDHEKEHLKLF